MASLVLEMPENDLYVPNSFTPDADEHNQSWGPIVSNDSAVFLGPSAL